MFEQFQSSLSVYLNILLFAMVDFVPLLRVRLKKNKLQINENLKNNNYTIVIPIFKHVKYLAGIEDHLAKYGNKLILATTNYEEESFYRDLYEIADRYNFKVIKVDLPIYNNGNYIVNTPAIFNAVVFDINTEYIIRMDADTYPSTDLSILFGNISHNSFDMVSCRVLPNPKQSHNIIWALQEAEYDLSMDNRYIYPQFTSGASIVGKTTVLREVSKHHSLNTNGEDVEYGKIAKLLGYRVGYLPFRIFTDVPITWKEWANQRGNWLKGAFRHNVVNIHLTIRMPWQTFYYVFIFYGLLAFRIFYSITHFFLLPVIFIIYITLILIFRFEKFKIEYFMFPIYALVQSTILPLIGIKRYFVNSLESRNWGLIGLNVKRNRPTMLNQYKRSSTSP